MKRLVLTTLAIIAVIGLLSAYEGDCQHRRGQEKMQGSKWQGMPMEKHHRGDEFAKLFAELDLSENQKDQIADLRSKHKKMMIELKADLEIIKVDKHEAMRDHDFSRVKKLIPQAYEIKEKMAMHKIELHEDFWELLTTEQREKAEELRGEHMRRNYHRKMKK